MYFSLHNKQKHSEAVVLTVFRIDFMLLVQLFPVNID